MTIHTWPEYRFAAIDIFVCGETADLQAACDTIVKVLKPLKIVQRGFDRGVGSSSSSLFGSSSSSSSSSPFGSSLSTPSTLHQLHYPLVIDDDEL
mmetsp:Transcript_103389/g.166660  ORF Transcript_103389/g.166660 Transcript_103389/m.166660 type:complete len:95 (+) Transcript_103389:340-624(+)